MADIHQIALSKGMHNLLESGRYSDLIVCCGAREFKIHRAILCERSPFFAAACNGNFQESLTGKIALEDDDVGAIERMITYLYTLDYDEGFSSSVVGSGLESHAAHGFSESDVPNRDSEAEDLETTSPTADPVQHTEQKEPLVTSEDEHKRTQAISNMLLANAQVYAVADKYDIPELKLLAKSKFLEQVSFLPSADDYSGIIGFVYESTPENDRGLRDAVVSACMGELRTMKSDPVFNAMLRDVGEFAIDLLYGSLKFEGERYDQILASKIALREKWVATSEARQDKIEELNTRVSNLKIERDSSREQLRQAIKSANSYKQCRHCDAEFWGMLEEDDLKMLRCRKCRTKHR